MSDLPPGIETGDCEDALAKGVLYGVQWSAAFSSVAKLLEDGAGDGTRTRDVQLGKMTVD